jgi:hypothetical protein
MRHVRLINLLAAAVGMVAFRCSAVLLLVTIFDDDVDDGADNKGCKRARVNTVDDQQKKVRRQRGLARRAEGVKYLQRRRHWHIDGFEFKGGSKTKKQPS